MYAAFFRRHRDLYFFLDLQVKLIATAQPRRFQLKISSTRSFERSISQVYLLSHAYFIIVCIAKDPRVSKQAEKILHGRAGHVGKPSLFQS